jgi:hypothetical protein
MLVYLDTADLINISRDRAPIDVPDLARKCVRASEQFEKSQRRSLCSTQLVCTGATCR